MGNVMSVINEVDETALDKVVWDVGEGLHGVGIAEDSLHVGRARTLVQCGVSHRVIGS